MSSKANATASVGCAYRISKDISSIMRNPLPGILIEANENDLTIIYALITGPEGTPYDKGFFFFVLNLPSDYPLHPPKVTFMTTAAGSLRFNPNYYANGKVCLSIIGTWDGPQWSPAQTIGTLLISIQSLLSEYPYYNEPGFDKEKRKGDALRYNEFVTHETIRVAVCSMLDNDYRLHIPDSMVEYMKKAFMENYEFYRKICNEKMGMDGRKQLDPFNDVRGVFKFSQLLCRLQNIRNRLLEETRASLRKVAEAASEEEYSSEGDEFVDSSADDDYLME